ncbi:pimeloyl-ACP methyl ester carboxylesterase [Streptomyces aurantiacus]|uniref:alpha/beta fold hydrolase n=1 Tax=Streptomyces aurantiacus TaxID=47760 RepID=UPI0027910A4F|nr:alpha/beta hydrolase [Streptomyces aurantiacus]MDQ0771872.1 pimeloyl-ACP methyl ester carboxylesterase [Streptomyces aurantiacus]
MTTTRTATAPVGATLPGVTHHLADINGTRLHYVSAGTTGSPILLVHGWPETWWAFRKLIPLLAQTHRVFAPDLRGFGDSGNADTEYGEAVTAEDLHHLVEHIGAGPVHLLCQDISGGTGFRFAATHPEDVISFTGVETTLAGFGLESLADVNNFGSWHVGFLGAPGIPAMLLPGHERELLADFAFPLMNGTEGSITESDVDEFVRTYARPNAWRGTEGLYRGVFSDNGATRALAESHPLAVPVLTVDGAGHTHTENTFRQVTAGEITAVRLDGVGHLIAQEAPEALAATMVEFTGRVDSK